VWSVCLYVCLLVMNPAKMAEPIVIQFGV